MKDFFPYDCLNLMTRPALAFVVITSVFLSSNASAVDSANPPIAKTYSVVMLKGPGFPTGRNPICTELFTILNRPENETAFGSRTKAKDINFSPRDKNFQSVQWKSISKAAAETFYPTSYVDKVLAADRENAKNFEKDWSGKGDYIFEKAEVDYDGHPPVETLIRYKFPDMAQGNCMFAYNTPNPERDYFNPNVTEGSYSSWGKNCGLLRYKGQIYLEKPSPSQISILKPQSIGYDMSGTRWNVADIEMCRFSKTN